MRKVLLLILVFVCSVAFGQGEIVKKGQKALTRNAKILKAHYPWEYNEPSDWINIHYCPKDEILMVASDEGDRYLSFYCTLQSSGSYIVEVYGGKKGDSLINSQTKTAGTVWSYQLPLGKGKPCSLGYTTYKIRLYPTLSTKKLLSFESRKHASSSFTNEGFLLLNANTSTLTTFKITGQLGGITATRFKYANLWNCTGLTTLQDAFFNCTAMVCATLGKTMDNLTNLNLMFFNCTTQVWVKFPKYLDNVTTAYGMCYNNSNLETVQMPISMNKLIQLGNSAAATSGAFSLCVKLKQLQYPLSLNSLTNFVNANYNCSTATYYRLPSSMSNVTSLYNAFGNNMDLTYLELPKIMNKLTIANGFINNDSNLTTLIFPDSMLLCNDLNDNLGLSNLDTISTCVWGTGQVLFAFIIRDLKTFKQPTLKVRKLVLRGASLATASALHTIDIDWANSTYGGSAPQIDIRWNSLSATTIDAIFTALPVVTGKTINVNGNPGSATCTPTIATAKGWTVII